MRIPSAKTDQYIFFVAYDSADHVTRKTGLSSFVVWRSRNAGTATQYTTPTTVELDNTNMPGVYALLIDEDTTIAAGSDSEEYCVHITKAGMDPVTRAIELFRRDVLTGTTLDTTELDKTTNAIGRGTVTSGASTTSVPTSALSIANAAASGVVADQFKGRVVLFDGATTTAGLRGAASIITANDASNTPTITVDPALPATPASGDLFSVI